MHLYYRFFTSPPNDLFTLRSSCRDESHACFREDSVVEKKLILVSVMHHGCLDTEPNHFVVDYLEKVGRE